MRGCVPSPHLISHSVLPDGVTLPCLWAECHWAMPTMGIHGCLQGLMGTARSQRSPTARYFYIILCYITLTLAVFYCLHVLSPTTIWLSLGQSFCPTLLGKREGMAVFSCVKGHQDLPPLGKLVRTGQM